MTGVVYILSRYVRRWPGCWAWEHVADYPTLEEALLVRASHDGPTRLDALHEDGRMEDLDEEFYERWPGLPGCAAELEEERRRREAVRRAAGDPPTS